MIVLDRDTRLTAREFDRFLVEALEARMRDWPGARIRSGSYNPTDPTAFHHIDATCHMDYGLMDAPEGPPPSGEYKVSWHDCTWGVEITVVEAGAERRELLSTYYDWQGRRFHRTEALAQGDECITPLQRCREILKALILSARPGPMPTSQ